MSYSQDLEHPLWQKRRLEMCSQANWKCLEPSCGADSRRLDVHHCEYIKGRKPWEYEDGLLMCLCFECHPKRQQMERAIHVSLAKLLKPIPMRRLEKIAWDLIHKAILENT